MDPAGKMEEWAALMHRRVVAQRIAVELLGEYYHMGVVWPQRFEGTG